MELSFVTGDVIYVYGDMDDDGFYMGELNGVRGLVPSNFLTEAPPDYEGGARGGGRRPMPPHLGPQDHRRPPGPGARGPPPPPREGAAGGHGPPHARDERGARKGRKQLWRSLSLRNKLGTLLQLQCKIGHKNGNTFLLYLSHINKNYLSMYLYNIYLYRYIFCILYRICMFPPEKNQLFILF